MNTKYTKNTLNTDNGASRYLNNKNNNNANTYNVIYIYIYIYIYILSGKTNYERVVLQLLLHSCFVVVQPHYNVLL